MTKNYLPNKNLLLLGASRGVGPQACLQLASEGFHVTGWGINEEKLRRIKREVNDIRGVFNYFVVKDDNQNEMQKTLEDIFDQLPEIRFLINLVGEYGLRLFSEIPLKSYRDAVVQSASSRVAGIYPFLINKHQKHQASPNLKHIIDLIGFGRAPQDDVNQVVDKPQTDSMPFASETRKPGQLTGAARSSRIYIEDAVKDMGVIADAEQSKSLIWDTAVLDKFPPNLIVNEILNLVGKKNYEQVDDVLMQASGKEVFSALYSLPTEGFCDAREPVLKTKVGEVLSVYVKDTSMGRALFANKDFVRGDLILQATGTVIEYQTEHSLQIGWHQHLDPDAPIRLINHSCEPNAGVKTNSQEFPDFFAFKDIRKDEEITFDYAMTEFAHQEREDPAMEFDLTCRCGSESCRGKLGYYSELPDDLKEKYQGFLSNYLVTSENQ